MKFLFIESLVKNATSFDRSTPTTVVGKTSPSSQMTLVKSRTSIPHLHSSVKGVITIFVVVIVVVVVVAAVTVVVDIVVLY
jgi:hypothetical protein